MKTSLQCLLLKIESATGSENPVTPGTYQTDPCKDCQLVEKVTKVCNVPSECRSRPGQVR